jgi:exonuclease SbcC
VVQLQTGGVRIAAMFIDEGFGSLDSASIGDAMEMLIRERQEGRLIGIISHVRELKDTIPLAVDVVKTPTGSRLRTEF